AVRVPLLPLARRASEARRARGRTPADDPRVSHAGPPAGGALVRTDVIVVGAGPAGAATAIFLAEHGLAVRLLDRARFPRPKICGEYLSPEAPRLLDRLGALKAVDAVPSPPPRIRVTAPDGRKLVGRYHAIGSWRPYREHAMALSREVLDSILVDRVRALPVELSEGVRVTDVVVSGDRVGGVEAVEADGRRLTLLAPL